MKHRELQSPGVGALPMPQLHATPEGGVFNLFITVTKTKQAVSFKLFL